MDNHCLEHGASDSHRRYTLWRGRQALLDSQGEDKWNGGIRQEPVYLKVWGYCLNSDTTLVILIQKLRKQVTY